GEDVQLPLERYFVGALRPSDERTPAHYDVLREETLPGLAVGGSGDPDELPRRHALAAGGTPEERILASGRALCGQPLIARPSGWLAAAKELGLAIAGHRWPLPRQDGHQRKAGVVGRHGYLSAVSRSSTTPSGPLAGRPHHGTRTRRIVSTSAPH